MENICYKATMNRLVYRISWTYFNNRLRKQKTSFQSQHLGHGILGENILPN